MPSEDISNCLIENQIIETNLNDDDKQSTSSPEVKIEQNEMFTSFQIFHHWLIHFLFFFFDYS